MNKKKDFFKIEAWYMGDGNPGFVKIDNMIFTQAYGASFNSQNDCIEVHCKKPVAHIPANVDYTITEGDFTCDKYDGYTPDCEAGYGKFGCHVVYFHTKDAIMEVHTVNGIMKIKVTSQSPYKKKGP